MDRQIPITCSILEENLIKIDTFSMNILISLHKKIVNISVTN